MKKASASAANNIEHANGAADPASNLSDRTNVGFYLRNLQHDMSKGNRQNHKTAKLQIQKHVYEPNKLYISFHICTLSNKRGQNSKKPREKQSQCS
jgi:hypothetical protein